MWFGFYAHKKPNHIQGVHCLLPGKWFRMTRPWPKVFEIDSEVVGRQEGTARGPRSDCWNPGTNEAESWHVRNLHPGRLTNKEPENTGPLEKDIHRNQTIIFRFYVNLRGCYIIYTNFTLLKTNSLHLKIYGWKMKIPCEMVLFEGTFLHFRGKTIKPIWRFHDFMSLIDWPTFLSRQAQVLPCCSFQATQRAKLLLEVHIKHQSQSLYKKMPGRFAQICWGEVVKLYFHGSCVDRDFWWFLGNMSLLKLALLVRIEDASKQASIWNLSLADNTSIWSCQDAPVQSSRNSFWEVFPHSMLTHSDVNSATSWRLVCFCFFWI